MIRGHQPERGQYSLGLSCELFLGLGLLQWSNSNISSTLVQNMLLRSGEYEECFLSAS
jgi:hypothetical protein